MPETVTVVRSVLDAMRAHAHRDLPRECCGLLAGLTEIITHSLPVANVLNSEREFFMDPAELISALRRFRELGLEHRGIYHSHPASDNFPSPRDVEVSFYPSCAYFIISLGNPKEREVRAFSIAENRVAELEIRVADGCEIIWTARPSGTR